MKKNILFLGALAVLLLIGCNGNESVQETETLDDITETTVIETADTNDPMIASIDCGGQTFTILSRHSDGTDYRYPYKEFSADKETGEAINDAVFSRNRYLEEKYHLVLNTPEDMKDNVEGVARKAIMAGDSDYDLLNIRYSSAYNLSIAGLLQNVTELPYVDFSKTYWWSSVMDSASIGGKNYFATGDMNLSSLNGVGVVFFNKELAETQQISNLYDVVRSGNWTFDTFTEFCKGVTSDLNGDSIYDEHDMYGLTTNGFAWQPFFAGTNSVVIDKDEDDIPVLRWNTERNISVIGRIVDLVNDKESAILMNQYPNIDDIGEASIKMFNENRALFWIEIIYGVLQLRNMNKDFGILPMPKYDLNQESYSSYLHCGWPCTIAVPATNDNLDLTGRILEDMAYYSSLTIRPAFYDVTLKGKVARDSDSAEMLDIIYSNINLDIAVLMADRLRVDTKMRNFLINNTTNFVSQIESLTKSSEKQLQKDIDKLMELEH